MKKLSLSLLAKYILDTRKEKKLSQKQLSELTGINRGMIVRLEAQDYIPSIPQLESLGEVLILSQLLSLLMKVMKML